MNRTSAVIFAPDGCHACDLESAILEGIAWCRRRGYRFVGVVRTWDDAIKVTRRGAASVIVVMSLDCLPVDRVPRVEVAASTDDCPGPGRRRPVRRPVVKYRKTLNDSP